jgi:hypothetical protein
VAAYLTVIALLSLGCFALLPETPPATARNEPAELVEPESRKAAAT